MNLEDLSPDLKAKAVACASPNELLELAKEEGYELSEDDLKAVSGGGWGSPSAQDCDDYDRCPADWPGH